VAETQRSTPVAWICLGLFATALALYGQSAGFDFVNYDDPDYINASQHGLGWALFSTEAFNWFPVTRLSHMADGLLFGMNSGAPHIENAIWHGAAAVLLFLFLNAATGSWGPSAFVAGIFVVHPLHVESVAWVAERKDVLCAVFWFASLRAYIWYTKRPGLERYLAVTVLFSLGLMSKPMIVTLPFVLLLLDVWPLGRGVKVAEKIPLFGLAAGASAIAWMAQASGGAMQSLGSIPFKLRLENALVSYTVYLYQTVWPVRLAVLYPFPPRVEWWKAAAAGVVLLAISAMAWRERRKRPYLAVGWAWFLGTLVPVIGLAQVGTQAHADRYMYVPMVGLLIMAAWGGAELYEKRPRVVQLAAVGAGLACVPLTVAQVACWQNSGTLFEHTLAVTQRNWIAEHDLGNYLMDEPGGMQEAMEHLRKSLEIYPDSAFTHSDMGIALVRSGRFQEAVAEFQEALRLAPDSETIAGNLRAAERDAAGK
jgi:hypothetical protein